METPYPFDPEFYQESYLSPEEYPGQDPLEHYRELGRARGNCPSASDYIANNLAWMYEEYLHQIINAFDWRAYRSRNKDIRSLSPLDTAYHFVQHGITEWRHFNEESKLLDRRFAVVNDAENAWHLKQPFQAVVHCYHYDVLCRLHPYLRSIARLGGRVCLLNCNSEILESVARDYLSTLYTGAVRHKIYNVPNHGEDWSSFHWAYEQGIFDNDGVTLKLQTKKSANLGIDGGMAWIDEALQPICGSYQAISRTLEAAAKHDYCAVASSWVSRCGFGGNPQLIQDYICRLGISVPESTDLFWRVENGVAIKSGKTGHPIAFTNTSESFQCSADSQDQPQLIIDSQTRQDLMKLDRYANQRSADCTIADYAPLSGLEVINYSWPFAAGSMFAATNNALRDFYQRLGSIDYSEKQAGGNEFCGRFVGHALERVFFYHIRSQGWKLDFL